MRLFFLYIIILLSCDFKKESRPPAHIDIEVASNNQYRINQSRVQPDELKKIILIERNRIIETGCKPEDVFIILRVDRNANVKSLSALEVILRQLNIRKIRYMKDQDISAFAA